MQCAASREKLLFCVVRVMEGLDFAGVYAEISLEDRQKSPQESRSSHEMPRPVLLVLGMLWAGLNDWMLVGAKTERIPMKSQAKASFLDLTILVWYLVSLYYSC